MTESSPELIRLLEQAMQLAIKCHQAGDLANAEALYKRVLAEDAGHAGALHNLGLIRLGCGDVNTALDLLKQAVRAMPREPVFLFNLGLAQQTAGDTDGAIKSYRKALRHREDYRECWENLGVVLQEQERFSEAENAYRHALRLDRCSPIAHKNLGNVLKVMGRPGEAEKQYLKALDCNPLNADIAMQYSATVWARGDFEAGWRWHEWRYWEDRSENNRPYHIPLPKWDGDAVDSLLLYGELGIGDEIMFASCIPDATRRAQNVAILCEPRLTALFARSFPNIQVGPKPRGALPPVLNPQQPCTTCCSIAGLPRFFRNREDDFPGEPYLFADTAATERWRGQLAGLGPGVKVGLSWRGGVSQHARTARSIALERLGPLFDIPDVHMINVQYSDHSDEIANFNADSPHPLVHFDAVDPLRDMDDFAALLTALDLVITVDNSTAHLAGALGVPTWLLLPSFADWRWMQQREDSCWYRSLRLFRQTKAGQDTWREVIANVRKELGEVTPRDQLTQSVATTAGGDTTALTTTPDVVLLNDTSYWYHWGCTCTSLAIHENLRAAGLAVDPVPIETINSLHPLPGSAAQFDDDDLYNMFADHNTELLHRLQSVSIIVINGEGSLHDLGQTARALLYLAYIAKQRLHKQVRIINHSVYPTTTQADTTEADAIYRKVYQALDFVAVREENSARELERLNIESTPSFDCLPLYISNHVQGLATPRERRLVLAGSVQLNAQLLDLLVNAAELAIKNDYCVDVLVGARASLAADDVHLLGLLQQRLRGRYTLVAATTEADWLHTIARANLLISGRFHHSIAAACLGTPFLVTASNTQKIDGLLKRLGLPTDTAWLPLDDIPKACERIEALLRNPQPGPVSDERLHDLRELALRNFDRLPPGHG